MNNPFDPSMLSELSLANPEPDDAARAAVVSLPVPLGMEPPAGLQGLATQGVDVAWWPPSRSGAAGVPRRRILCAVSETPLPASVRLGAPAPAAMGPGPATVALRDIRKDYASLLPHHSSEVVLARGGVELALRLGLRWRDELHWWQWLRVESLWSGPVAAAYRVGGAIEVVPTTVDDVYPDRKNIRKSEWLHRQNWLFGEAYLVCFANGVVQCWCRHINNHQFDEGRDQRDVTPLLALGAAGAEPIDRPWTGAEPRITIGPARLNLADCATLVSEAHPGSLRSEDGLVLFQPYAGFDIGGDAAHLTGTDGFFFHAADKVMPRGVARTVRFCVSLGEAAPVVTRLVAPDWWYAVSGDLWPDGALPVRDDWDPRIEATYQDAIIRRDMPGRFDDCAAALGREGEVPFVQFMYAQRTGDPAHWRRALRDAYHIADIAFDHATETIRMHNYPFDGTISPALFRILGLVVGHLETGDPYLRECAESAALNFLCLDRHNWPRYSYGRDAMSVRGLVFLADYLGSDQYRAWAREALGRVIQCQLPDGSYHDQGGGVGIHAVGQLPVKPWMANMATNPIIDYLQRWPDDPALWEAVRQYGGFLLRAGAQPDGSVRWPYQVSYGGTDRDPWRTIFNPGTGMDKLPDQTHYAISYKARSLSFLTARTGDPAYFDAWLKFYDTYWRDQLPNDREWSVVKALYHLPYAQAHAWNARWRDGALEIDPLPSRHRTELAGTISTPRGPVRLKLRRTDPQDPESWEIIEQDSEVPARIVRRNLGAAAP